MMLFVGFIACGLYLLLVRAVTTYNSSDEGKSQFDMEWDCR